MEHSLPPEIRLDHSEGRERSIPLCLDLDETLLRTDIVWESAAQLWHRPVVAFRALQTLCFKGKAAFKLVLATEVNIDPATLPYRQEVLEFAQAQRATGRALVLATAAHRIVAQRVADYLGLFARVFATEGETNLSGEAKLLALESCYGKRGFDYVGDGRRDLPVFAGARAALLVNPSRALLERAAENKNILGVFSDDDSKVRVVARALRLHQWVKNVLLVVPLLAAHKVMDPRAWAYVALSFVAFGLVASATYLLNDLVDLQADRRHPQKRSRPLASGRMSIPIGLLSAISFGALGAAFARHLLSAGFCGYLAVYVALTLGYSFDLKRRLLVYPLEIILASAAKCNLLRPVS